MLVNIAALADTGSFDPQYTDWGALSGLAVTLLGLCLFAAWSASARPINLPGWNVVSVCPSVVLQRH